MKYYFPAVFDRPMTDVFDGFGREFFHDLGRAGQMMCERHPQRVMNADVKETDEGYEIDMDLPGFNKEEIRLELHHGYLTVTAERSNEKNSEDSQGRMLLQERYTGMLRRGFRVGRLITEDDVKASFTNGVLHVLIPRKEAPEAPEKKQIMIAG